MDAKQNNAMSSAVKAGRRSPRVIIIGTGLSGVVMGMRLKLAGVDDITLYEMSNDLGGTWHYNSYPGLRCDVPSHYYQYSFETKGDWSHRFCGATEIRQYYVDMAKKYDIYDAIKFNTKIVNADYRGGRWHVDLEGGETDEADFLISAVGILIRPKFPEIEGLDSFEGKVIHSARWDHDVQMEGKRVAIIGNGSTGVQMIRPLSEVAAKVTTFQRTPQWVVPVPNRKYSKLGQWLAGNVPGLSKLYYYIYRFMMEQMMGRGIVKDGWSRRTIGKVCQWHLNTVKDPELRKKLTPTYTAMCKRLVMSSDFYPSMQKDNVELVVSGIDHIEPNGIVDNDGKLHEIDVVALATGYHAGEYMLPMTMSGENGATLADAWKDGARAYRTVAMPDFPNFFMVMGPHSPVGNFSLASVAESQSEYIMQFIEMWRDNKFQEISPTEEATEKFNQEMLDNMKTTVWLTGCSSWYLDENGVPGSWPWTATKFRKDMGEANLDEFVVKTQ